jgi:hypothetical protein
MSARQKSFLEVINLGSFLIKSIDRFLLKRIYQMFHTDLFKEFTFDPRANRYRVVSGVGKGFFISKKAFLAQTEKYIEKKTFELVSLADKIENKTLSLRDFQLEATKILKEIHTSKAIIAANGVENMTSERWLIVANELKKQYYQGKDPVTGRRYGIKYLVEDLKKGNVSLSQLRTRLQMYADSGKRSFWQQKEFDNKDKKYAQRFLGIAEHCQECLTYASWGVTLRELLPLPTEKCTCRTRCKCSIVFSDSLKS